jgi:hypothetical protein
MRDLDTLQHVQYLLNQEDIQKGVCQALQIIKSLIAEKSLSTKIVYVSSPYTKGDQIQNVRTSILAAERLRQAGFLPFAPLLSHFWHFVAPHNYDYWLDMDLDWIEKADMVLRLPGISHGADKEVARALYLGIPVYCTIDDLCKQQNELSDIGYVEYPQFGCTCQVCQEFVKMNKITYPYYIGSFYTCVECGAYVDVA